MKKRKDFVHHFPSLSPATKSRRLEVECELYSAMMIEEEENVRAVDPTPSSPVTATEERALVLYDPIITSPFHRSPSSTDFTIVVKADLIPGLKDYLLSWGIATQDKPVEDELMREKSSEVSKDLAVVPWVSFHSPMACEELIPETGQPLDAEEGEMMEMD